MTWQEDVARFKELYPRWDKFYAERSRRLQVLKAKGLIHEDTWKQRPLHPEVQALEEWYQGVIRRLDSIGNWRAG